MNDEEKAYLVRRFKQLNEKRHALMPQMFSGSAGQLMWISGAVEFIAEFAREFDVNLSKAWDVILIDSADKLEKHLALEFKRLEAGFSRAPASDGNCFFCRIQSQENVKATHEIISDTVNGPVCLQACEKHAEEIKDHGSIITVEEIPEERLQ